MNYDSKKQDPANQTVLDLFEIKKCIDGLPMHIGNYKTHRHRSTISKPLKIKYFFDFDKIYFLTSPTAGVILHATASIEK